MADYKKLTHLVVLLFILRISLQQATVVMSDRNLIYSRYIILLLFIFITFVFLEYIYIIITLLIKYTNNNILFIVLS